MDDETLRDRAREAEDAKTAANSVIKKDSNHTLLPREMSEAKKLKGTDYSDQETLSSGQDRGFSVILHTKNPGKPFEKMGAGTTSTPTGGERSSRSTAQLRFPSAQTDKASSSAFDEEMTPDNYLKLYERRKRETEEAKKNKKTTNKEELAKNANEKKKADNETLLRVRARELLDQIYWWRGQYDTGIYETAYINGMIATLEQEVGGIDPRYWP